MEKKVLLFAILFLRFFSGFSAGNAGLVLDPISVKDIFVSDNIHDIYVEDSGLTWFAGLSGISRYDGYDCYNYNFSSSVDGLESSTVVKIVRIKDDVFWLLTKSHQLVEFYPQTGVATVLKPGLPDGVGLNDVIALSDNQYYLGTTDGLFLYDRVKGECSLQKYKGFLGEHSTASVRSLFKDKSGNIWVGTWGNGIFVIEQGGIKIRSIILRGIAPEAKVNEFIQTASGYILAATWADGLLEIGLDDHVVKRKAPLADGDKGWNIIYSLCYDSDNNLFMGTPKGIWELRVTGESVCHTTCMDNTNNAFELSEVVKVCGGINDDMWVSLYGRGVSRLLPPQPPIRYVNPLDNGIGSRRVDAILPDPHNPDYVWFGIQGEGAVLFNMRSGTFDNRQYSAFLETINHKANSVRNYLYCQSTDQLFIATRYDGLYIANYENGIISSFERVGLPNNAETRCGLMAVDNGGNAFVTLRSGGMFMAAIDSVGHHSYIPLNVESKVSTAFITSMIIDSAGCLLMGTENGGMVRLVLDYESKMITSAERIDSPNPDLKTEVYDLFCDSQGRVWVGTNNGLMSYSPETRMLESVVPRSHAHFPLITQITEDDYGNLWLAGASYIIRYSPSSINGDNDYACYSNSRIDFSNGVIASSSSTVYMGGVRGALFFNVDSMPIVNNKVSPFVSDITVLDQSVLKRRGEMAFPYSHDLTVCHDENSITIKFSAYPYSYDNNYEYAYMMWPLEKTWQLTPASQRSVTYSKLAPGKYQFRLRVSSQTGDWSDDEYCVNIRIKRSPWASPFAILLYVMSGLSILLLIVSLGIKSAKAEKERYKEKMEGQKAADIYNAKLSFLTNISHEIFTPITVITCSLERLLLKDAANKKTYLLMKANLTRVMRMMQQSMDFSKNESSKLSLSVSLGDISKFVESLCNDSFSLDNSHTVKIEFHSYPDSVIGYFDADKLDKIMYNLISNAYKYNKPNGMVFVSVSRDANCAVVKVRDTGYGIEPETLPHIFDLFNEGERRKHMVYGTGIGLSLTKELVRLHKGEIKVSSIVNQGTVFTVSIPITADAYKPSEINQVVEENGRDLLLGDQLYDKTILIAEDNEELLMAMKNIVSLSYNVLCARDGSEALAVCKEKIVDLMLVDYQMPNMNGEELCRIIRSDIRISHIPIIIVSAYSSKEYKLRAFNAGADAYVLKPFDTTLLMAQVSSIIGNRRSLSDNFERSFFVNISELSRNALDSQFLEKIVYYIKEHLSTPDSNRSLSSLLNMSESSMYRKIKGITGMSPQEFTRKLRFKLSCEMLSDQANNIADVAYKLGFTDPRYFSKCFKREFGITPREFRKNHSGEVVPPPEYSPNP